MKVLVIGSGGREHCLVWKISRSSKVKKIYCIPGNAGISEIADCRNISTDDFTGIADFVKKEKITLTIVGPEAPLVKGIADHFAHQGLPIFGPSKEASRLEGSKVFAKRLMRKYGIPTAPFEIFSDSISAIKYIKKKGAPVVIKADGLAAGKGAIVARTMEEAEQSVHKILDQKIFGEAGNQIVVEDYLEGEEASILAFVDGKAFLPLISSQDHKQVYDGDKGPNTGGMGAYSPAPLITQELQKKISQEIFERLIGGLNEEGITYNGILYAGIMVSKGLPYVLEFNVRFGDPETQAILPLLDSDLVELIDACVKNRLKEISIEWKKGACVCVVLASRGYPDSYEKGFEIKGLEKVKNKIDVFVFHAGTTIKNCKLLTSGGRVLGVTATGRDLRDARDKAYGAIEDIYFEGMHYRKDIGIKALKYGG